MFAASKKPATPPPNYAAALQKFMALPPAVDLVIAAAMGIYGLVAVYVEGTPFFGVVCIVIALAFAFLGIAATQRDMRAYKIVASAPTPKDLRALSTQEFEKYLIALFSLAGYQVRSGADELHRQDDADLIAVRKKEIALIQFNHFNEEYVSIRALESLHKAASLMRATDAIAITLGEFAPDAAAWATRKGVRLMTEQDIVRMAAEFTGEPTLESEVSASERSVPVAETNAALAHLQMPHAPSAPNRILFIDFAGISVGMSQLEALLTQHPAYDIIASTLPPGETIDTLRSRQDRYANRIIGALPPSSLSRYFAIQDYLHTTMGGRRVQWLAIDSRPQMFPEGATELIAVNQAFGLDANVVNRVREMIALADSRAKAAG